MSANVETMFSTRQKPWHGIGSVVSSAPSAEDALRLAGLDWEVEQKDLYIKDHILVPNYKCNVRNTDGKILGVVSDRYEVVQNHEAFSFTNSLLESSDIKYETAGSLNGGKQVWLLAKLPAEYIISDGERISPYLCFVNSHNASSSIFVAITPIRVVCQNTLNLALAKASRSWSARHTGNVKNKLEEARNTLIHAERYMDELSSEILKLQTKRIPEFKVKEYIEEFFPITADMSNIKQKNMKRLREDMALRYMAPDLKDMPENAYRFINMVSDFATHAAPIRKTENHRENLFIRTIEGNPLIDKAYQIACAA